MKRVLRERLARAATGAVLLLPAPVLAGDWPDPSVIRTDDDYVAVSTANDWAPMFRVLRSPDLGQWRVAGSVFRRPPRWARSDFWAPEITRFGRGYAVFYSALPRKKGSWLCLGVATAPAPEGPWRDAGRPLRCGRDGSIDPYPVRDERGRLYLLWKQDGNEFKRPTPILAQRLREDGRRLFGRVRELIRNDRRWEKHVVEAPHVVRSGGWFYLLYSANSCCTRSCAYAVGVARARTLLGRWRKHPGNPILRSGGGWRCPGHVTLADDGAGGLAALFHAYRAGEGRIAGRQILAAPFTVGADGWPKIGPGRRITAGPPGAAPTSITDVFAGPLAPEWEWRMRPSPRISTGDGLSLTAPRGARSKLNGAVLGRRVGSERYTAEVVLDRGALERGSQGGVASYRSGFEAIGISAGAGRAVIWERRFGAFRRRASAPVPQVPLLHLRMVARGNRFRFELSADGLVWQRVGPSMRGPIEESARVALTAGGVTGARARFVSATVTEDE